MMSLRSKLYISIAVTTFALTAQLANAGEFGRQYNHRPRPPVVGHSGLPSVVPGNGTYSGSTAALHIRGNGTYLVGNGSYGGRRSRPPVLAPMAKIIDVQARAADANCHYQGGVCIIRN